jgi:hypothetical protein
VEKKFFKKSKVVVAFFNYSRHLGLLEFFSTTMRFTSVVPIVIPCAIDGGRGLVK